MVESNEYGDRLKKILGNCGIRPVELAELLGVSRSSVTRWTNGENVVPSEYLVVLTETRGLDVNWYLTGKKSLAKIDVMAELRESWRENDRLREELGRLGR